MSPVRDSVELMVPSGWFVDWIGRDRLERALAVAPTDVVGAAALGGPLPPGSSYRTHAEWLVLEGVRDGSALVDGPVEGAVLVRAGTDATGMAGGVTVEGNVLRVAGTHAHDPTAVFDQLRPASPESRSPFPVRPIVVFLALDRAPEPWVTPLVNALVGSDVEARLAVSEQPAGPHLTRPCEASAESMETLAPDAVVTLDSGAREIADEWCGSHRSTVVVDTDPGLASSIDLVDWQIGRASGRLRARIGPEVDAPAVASLVARLAAGPQPIAPSTATP